MAFSDNLISMDPSWIFRNTFPDTWLPDNLSIETNTLAKALQKSFDTHHLDNINFSEEFICPWLKASDTKSTVSCGSTATTDSVAAVDPALDASNKVRPNGKSMKRKSRASKKSTTTFINADVGNFRQLVQQVTGGGGGGGGMVVVKPEARRGGNRLEMIGGGGGGGLPTLDTSAFLVEPICENNQVGPTSAGFNQVAPPSAVVGDRQFDFDSFCSFPTLESWKGI